MDSLLQRILARLSLGPDKLWALWRGPLLSIIVPVYNVEDYLDDCLESLRTQYYRRIEIIVVDDGSPDDSANIASRHAAEDPRITIIRQQNAGLSAARNTGVAAAKGRFLTFVDSDDTVELDGFAHTMLVLRRTGSDFAVMPYRRMRETATFAPSFTTPPWIAKLFAKAQHKTTLSETPQIMVHAIACAKIFRRSFWDRAQLAFVPGMTYEDQVFTAEAYVKAKSIDIVDVVTYNWRVTEDSITSVFDVDAAYKRFDAAAECLKILSAVDGAASARAIQLLTNDFASYVRAARNAEDGYLEVLYDRLPTLLDFADHDTVQAITPSEIRVLYHLIRLRDTAAIHAFFSAEGLSPGQFNAGVEDVGPVVYLPGWDDPSIPRETFELTERQMTFRTSVLFGRWRDDGALELKVLAYFDHLESAAHAPTARAWLQHKRTGVKYHVGVEFCDEYVGNLAGVIREAHVRSVYSVVVDPRTVGTVPPGVLKLHLEFEVFGHKRVAVVNAARPEFSAGFSQPRVHNGQIWRLPVGKGMAVVVAPAVWTLDTVSPSGGGIQGAAVGPNGRRKQVVLGDLNADGENRVFVRLLGRKRPVVWPASIPSGIVEAAPGLLLVCGQDGETKAAHERSIAYVEGVDVDAEAQKVTVAGRWFGEQPESMTLTMASARARVAASSIRRDGADFTATFPLIADPWGRGNRPLPLGDYSVVAEADGRVAQVRSNPALAAEVPKEFAGEPIHGIAMRGMLIRVEGNNVGLRIDPPLTDLERSAHVQRVWQNEYRASQNEVDPQAVFFQCYLGETASDSELSLHREFCANSATWKLYWGVTDHSVPLPEGAIPVVIGSRAWYDAFAGAKYLVTNVDLPVFYTPRPGQVHVQTFHGQPFKSMGATYWREMKRFPEYRVRHEATRRSGQWDLILTPDPEANHFYRDEYFYDGPIFDEGLPRTDALVEAGSASAGSANVRARTRQTLGIGDDQTAILFAATFRDDRATGHLAARDVDFLDMEELARQLGPSFVLLQRSHGAVARTHERHGDREGVIDVTDYPDINDVTLASDAAVLDYSSLRFDYGLTGNPMVFFIPDYDDYAGTTRGFLFDFVSSAPGPCVSTRAGLIEKVRDLGGVKTEYAEAYAGFDRRFNSNHDGKAGARLLEALLTKRHGV